ncbi:S9 family peptidase [Salinimicrobium sp. MT39]|jgi:oligopeptidase B|uniref:Proline-specific endopeptidase n=1 Tax=Salinimicrobium profundisediminis TaxID=2994553 RepID=A0A9X3CZW7_9FLAO|nr:S9 family peptidase [Salinimicrobium profundisediminis]MCX2839785.1 S9 family peptidase [Salinimicrobium profundisediminis]
MKVVAQEIKAPRAKKIPVQLEKHGDVRIDDYFWLRERENPEVLDYLTRENDYNERMTAHTKQLQEDLFQEVKKRIKEDDSSVPYKLNGYWYVTRFEKGKDYPIYSRKKETLDAPEEILFDVNEMAKGHDYYRLSGLSVSPNNKLISYAVDTVSRRKYTLYIKNLETGEVYPEKIKNTTGGATWANDNKTLFYARKDEETLRSNKIFKHRLGTKAKEDELVFFEEDETFHTYVYKSKSQRYIIIGSDSTLTSEYRFIAADDPHGELQIVQPRIRGVEYGIAHYRDSFYILTNKDGATNFKLMKAPVHNPGIENWEEVIPHREHVLLEDIDLFRDYLVVSERSDGLNKIHIRRWDGTDSYFLPFDNETYTAFTGTNPDFDTEILRYTYNSLTTPTQVVDFNMRTREKDVKKELEVLGGKFQKENYVSDRIWATARDGAKIPMTLVHRKELKRDGKNPVLQYAYGSYGSTIDPYFSNVRLSLLDRGFIFVIAHVRGGEYLGRQWYEDGKLLKKKNTFTDFIDCTRHLIEEKYTSAEHMYASGGSAGGLLMGAVANMAPQLYKGIIASVPFVDVVTTMLDESIPLTTGEYDEWGNPNDAEYYTYMKSYSPYDNVTAQNYPNMLVTTGLHDSQVQYWEPAKWVAKLRELKTDSNKLLFHTNMEAGHGGASGRFEALREVAEEYAFLLDLEGMDQ